MLAIIFKGILLGIILSSFIGATFFMLIETSINKGFRMALAMNLGVFLSDALCIVAVYLGLGDALTHITESKVYVISAGIFLMAFGIAYILRKESDERFESQPLQSKYLQLFIKGFTINLINPSVLIFWMGALIFAASTYQYKGINMLVYFGTALFTVFSIDLIKIYTAKRLRKYIEPHFLHKMRVITGIVLMIIGLLIALGVL